MEFALIPILLVYPVSACFGGSGCCRSQQQGCGYFCGGGISGGKGGYAVPSGGGSYVAPALSAPSSYNVPLAPGGGSYAVGLARAPPSSYGVGPAPAPPPSYGVGPALAPPSYGVGPALAPPSYGAAPAPGPSYNPPQAGPSPGFYGGPQAPSYSGGSSYGGQQGASPPPSFTGTQSQFRDPSLGGAQAPLLPPENPSVPGRFAEAVEQATLPDGGAIDLAGISSASSSIGEPIEGATHEAVQQQASTASTIQAVPVITKNNKLRHW